MAVIVAINVAITAVDAEEAAEIAMNMKKYLQKLDGEYDIEKLTGSIKAMEIKTNKAQDIHAMVKELGEDDGI